MRRRPDLSGDRWEGIRRRILHRDGWRCRECGRPGRLEVHHEISPLIRPDLAHDPENLKTLCRDCHISLHGRTKVHPEIRAWRDLIKQQSR